MIKYVLAAVWGAGVATLWWAFACLEVSGDMHKELLVWAVITSVLTLIGMVVLLLWEETLL